MSNNNTRHMNFKSTIGIRMSNPLPPINFYSELFASKPLTDSEIKRKIIIRIAKRKIARMNLFIRIFLTAFTFMVCFIFLLFTSTMIKSSFIGIPIGIELCLITIYMYSVAFNIFETNKHFVEFKHKGKVYEQE